MQANGQFGPVNHNFQVNKGLLEVNGVQGIIDAYHSKIGDLMFSGPTCFTPIIQDTLKRSKCTQDIQQYTVLLMITDGEITDMDTTIEAVIRASDAPMSVLIVGVGPCEPARTPQSPSPNPAHPLDAVFPGASRTSHSGCRNVPAHL